MSLDLLSHLEHDAATITGLLRTTPPDAPVPGCPGWLLRDLVAHLSGVHRWATAVVRTGARQPQQAAAVPDAALADWFATGAGALLAALREVPADAPVWTFDGGGPASFWHRRQAHETAVHRVDVQRAAGLDVAAPQTALDPELAEDGIAEVLEVMLPRQVALGRTPAPTTGARLVTGSERLLGVAPPTVTVEGPAAAVLLLLWRRTGADDPRLAVSGDRAALDALLAVALTP